jgi:hypothetical protein
VKHFNCQQQWGGNDDGGISAKRVLVHVVGGRGFGAAAITTRVTGVGGGLISNLAGGGVFDGERLRGVRGLVVMMMIDKRGKGDARVWRYGMLRDAWGGPCAGALRGGARAIRTRIVAES